MNTKSATTALGAIRTRSFRNAATTIQSASPDGSISSPAVCYQWFQIEVEIQKRPLKALGQVLFAGQFSRLTHPMVLFTNMVHVLQSVQYLINYPVICTLHQLSIWQLMYSQLMGWAQSNLINFRLVTITSKEMQRFHTHPNVDFSNVFLIN